jgi:hypothetical protein
MNMRKTITFLMCVVVAITAMSQTYNAHDLGKLRAFLVQPSGEEGQTNGEILGLTAEEVAALEANEAWVEKISDYNVSVNVNVCWTDDSPKRLAATDWGMTYLSGHLDLSGCTALTGLSCYSPMGTDREPSELTILNVSGCSALTNLNLRNIF